MDSPEPEVLVLDGPKDWFGRVRAHCHMGYVGWELCTDGKCPVYQAAYEAHDKEQT